MRHPSPLMLLGVCASFAMSAHGEGMAAQTSGLHEVRGAKLYVQTYGDGAPIVFLHGGVHHFENSFAPQRDYFASFRKVVGVDQRGHGHSPDTAKPFSYQDMADDTAALIQQLGMAPVDVVGHSDGGNVGLLLARDHPQLLLRLVVSGANLRSSFSAEEEERRKRMSPEEVARGLPPSFEADYAKVTPDGREHWLTVVAKSWKLWMTPIVIAPADLKRIKVPVLVIAGDHDLTSIEEATETYRGLPRGQLLILPATGHGTFQERPEIVNQVIRAFLEEPNSATAPR